MPRFGFRPALALAALTLSAYLAVGPLPAIALGPEQTVLVTLTADASVEAAQELVASSGGHVVERLKPLRVLRVAVPAAVVLALAAARIAPAVVARLASEAMRRSVVK